MSYDKNGIKNILNTIDEMLNKEFPCTLIANKKLMQRGMADLLEVEISDKVESKAEELSKMIDKHIMFEAAKSKRSIEDFQLVWNVNEIKFDVKTTEENKFSMPNLISIDRLKKYYLKNPNHFIVYIFVDYYIECDENNKFIHIRSIKSSFIENISWNCLKIQNLGKGQLQIINKDALEFDVTISREEWFGMLKIKATDFYNDLIKKTKKRLIEWESM